MIDLLTNTVLMSFFNVHLQLVARRTGNNYLTCHTNVVLIVSLALFVQHPSGSGHALFGDQIKVSLFNLNRSRNKMYFVL